MSTLTAAVLSKAHSFLQDLEVGCIPKRIAITTDEFGATAADFSKRAMDMHVTDFQAREQTTRHFGMWALVDMEWTARLADWIGRRTVLEIMAGHGWLAKALSLHGVACIATDNRDQDYHSRPVFPVRKMPAIKAVKRYRADLLIVSWPPYECHTIVEACKWRGPRPMIYIGEDEGGCNAPDEFWHHFVGDILEVCLPQWQHIHDCVWAGHWRGPCY